jgi:hypothetical protein
MQLMIIILLVAGGIAIYAAIKGQDPRDIVKNALGAK